MEQLDLDINNYTIEDIKNLYDIDNNIKINNIYDKFFDFFINNYDLINQDKNLFNFFVKTKNILIEHYNKINKERKKHKNSNNRKAISYTCEGDSYSDSDSISDSSNETKNDNTIINRTYNYDDFNKKRREKLSKHKNIFVEKYPVSTLNPIKKKIITKIISVDSVFKQPGENTNDFTFTLAEPLKNVVSMKLTSFEMPNFAYLFCECKKNNRFKIKLYNVSISQEEPNTQEHNIIIPEGNYTPQELKIIMNYLLNKHPALSMIYFDIDRYTNKSIFRAKTLTELELDSANMFLPYDPENEAYNEKFSFELIFNEENNIGFDCGCTLGFLNGYYKVDINNQYINNIIDSKEIIYKGFVCSESYFGNTLNTYLYLDIDDFNKNSKNNICLGNSNIFKTNNIIARIPVNTSLNNILINNASDQIFKEREYFGNVNIDKLRIRIFDKYSNLIQINNANYAFSLEVSILYS